MDEFEQEPYGEEQPEEKRSILRSIVSGLIAVVIIAGFFWWSSLANVFLYRETPAFEIAPVTPMVEVALDAQTLAVPLNVIVFVNDGELGSMRDRANVEQLIENAERIWAQAGIGFTVVAIREVSMSDDALGGLLDTTTAFVQELDGVDLESINVFLVRKLRGINGVAFIGLRSVAVADLTTVNDYRAFAHEIGHILDLSHTARSPSRLMYRGVNGTALTEREILQARGAAQRW